MGFNSVRWRLMDLFTATGKLKKFFLQEKFDVCTTGDTVHIDTISKFLPQKHQHGCIHILFCCNNIPCIRLLLACFSTHLMTSYQFHVVTYKERTGRIWPSISVCLKGKKAHYKGPKTRPLDSNLNRFNRAWEHTPDLVNIQHVRITCP
jgi:hypothetical protein